MLVNVKSAYNGKQLQLLLAFNRFSQDMVDAMDEIMFCFVFACTFMVIIAYMKHYLVVYAQLHSLAKCFIFVLTLFMGRSRKIRP